MSKIPNLFSGRDRRPNLDKRFGTPQTEQPIGSISMISAVFDYRQSVVVNGWFDRETFNAIKIKFMYQITIKHGRLSAWIASWTKMTTKVLLNVTKQDNKSWASPCVCAPCGFPDEVAHFGTGIGSESRRSKWDQMLVCFWREAGGNQCDDSFSRCFLLILRWV